MKSRKICCNIFLKLLFAILFLDSGFLICFIAVEPYTMLSGILTIFIGYALLQELF